VSIRLLQDTVIAQRGDNWVRFKISAVVRNDDTRTLHVNWCGHSLWREVNGEWQLAWRQECSAAGFPATPVTPGDSLTREIDGIAITDGSGGPGYLLPGPIEGLHRLVVAVGFSEAPESSQLDLVSRSPAFFLRVP
jgi:hypothetical protein